MLTLPNAIVSILIPFATLFTNPTWRKAQVLLVGAILTPGQRTVAAALRVMGRSDHRDYARYHEVLNRAVWSPRAAARILLVLLLQHLDGGDGPLVFGIRAFYQSGNPGTASRRQDQRSGHLPRRGAFQPEPTGQGQRPAVDLPDVAGPRALGRTPLGLAGAHGAGAIDAVLPTAGTSAQEAHRLGATDDHATAPLAAPPTPGAGGRQQLCRAGFAPLLPSLREPVTLIARLRLDAALYAPAPPRQPGQNGRPPLKGPRRPPLKVFLEQTDVTWASAEVAWYDGITRAVELTSQTAVWYRSGKPPVLIRWVLIRDPQGSFATQALLCTDPAADPTQILEWFVLRWQLEVTFQEVRTHLGVETQRQWSDLAIARTTPALLGLFSWTTLAAHALQKRRPMTQRKAAWYDKPSPTFVDAIALARRHLWLASEGFSLSVADPDIQELPVALYHRLVDSLAYAA